MKFLLKFLWELPQNILGFLYTRFNVVCVIPEKENTIYYKNSIKSSVSLGNFIVIATYSDKSDKVLKHEKGHAVQSKYLGPFYLIIIGIPSALGNIYDRIFHKKWSIEKRMKWYFSLPWEAWADKLGGVKRNFK